MPIVIGPGIEIGSGITIERGFSTSVSLTYDLDAANYSDVPVNGSVTDGTGTTGQRTLTVANAGGSISWNAANGGLFSQEDLIGAFNSFSIQDQNSIASNFQEPLKEKQFLSLQVPFKLKYLLTVKGKVEHTIKELVYVGNKTHLVLISWQNPTPVMNIVTEEQIFKNVKLNERTSKFLLACPNLEDIPFSVIVTLIKQGALKQHNIVLLLQKIEETPKSHIVVAKTEKGSYVTDLTTFTTYEVSKSGELKQSSAADINQLAQDPEIKPKIDSTIMAEVDHGMDLDTNSTRRVDKFPITVVSYLKNNLDSIPFRKRILKKDTLNLINSLT